MAPRTSISAHAPRVKTGEWLHQWLHLADSGGIALQDPEPEPR